MKKFLMATGNAHKIAETGRILEKLNITVVSPKDIDIDLGYIEENGKTFAQNAYIKAKAAYDISGLPSIADDSGLCIDALNGEPGVYSSRYAGENATDKDRIDLVLSKMKNVKCDKRQAHFTCSICCILNYDTVITAEGHSYGKIAVTPSGANGFGYDPIFISDEYNLSFAELNDEQKDKVSHRGRALEKFFYELSKINNI